jgi:MFS family permease
MSRHRAGALEVRAGRQGSQFGCGAFFWLGDPVTVWRHRRFRLFWTGDTISALGGALSTVALPLLAIKTLGATPGQVGVLRSAQTLPFLLFAVPIGLLADRISRRRLLLAADALRFPLVGLIALAGAALGVRALTGLVFVVGVGTVAYEVAYLSVLPELVDGPAELPAANRAVETAHAGSGLIGPALGGVLVGALTPAGTVALDAISFGVGAALTLVNRWETVGVAPVRRRRWMAPRKRRTVVVDSAPPSTGRGRSVAAATPAVDQDGDGPERGRAASAADQDGPERDRAPSAVEQDRNEPERGRTSLLGGWTWLWRDRFVRPMTLYLAVNNLAAQAFQTALLVYLMITQHHSGVAVGLAFAASGAGFLAGAAVSPAAARRFGTGRVIIAASLLGALGIGVVAAGGFALVLAGSALAGAGPGLLNLHSIAVRQAITPPGLRGRVNAVVKTISYGSTTIGAFLGGAVAGASGPRTVIGAAAVVSALATGFPAFSAVRLLRRLE